MGAPVRRCARERARCNRLHLPDAPGVPQRPSWQLPDLRHAPQGGWCGSGNGRRRRRPRAAARRRAGESRAAAGDRRPARRRQPVGRHAAAADDRARGGRREPDVSDRRRRERLDPQRGERHDGRRREKGPGARVVRSAGGRVQECAAVVLHGPRSVLPHGRHAAAAAATGAIARLRARRGDRPDGRRAAQHGCIQLAAQGNGQAPRARAGHPHGIAGGRRRAEAQRLARPPVRSRLRVLPDRGSQPRVDSGRRVPPPAAVHPPRRLRADHHGGREPRSVGDGESVGTDLRRGDADAEGAARGLEPAAGAQARHVRRRGVPGRPPGDARRAGGCDRGLGAAQNGVRRPRQRGLRAAAGRDGVARRRRRRGDERAHAWRADRDLGHLLRRFREPHEGSHAHGASAAPVLDPVCGMHVDPREAGKAGRTAAHGEHEFFFCSDNCKQRFVADPSRHAKRTVAKP